MVQQGLGRLRACFGLMGGLSAGWTVRIPAVQLKLALSNGQLGLEVLGWGVATLLAMHFSAALMRRYGTTAVLKVALPALAVSVVPVGLANSFPVLLATGALFGLGYGFAEVSGTSAVSGLEISFDRPLMGGMHASWSIGAVIGGLLGAAGAAARLSFTSWMLLLGAIGSIVALVLVVPLARTPPRAETEPGTEPSRRRRLPGVVLLFGAIAAAAYLAEGTVADWSGLYLLEFTGTSQALASVAYPLTEAVVIGARLLADRMAAPGRYPVLVAAASSIAAGSFVLTATAPDVWVALAGFVLIGASIGVIAPLTLSTGARRAGDLREAAVSRLSTIGYAGFLLGPVVIGFASETWSLATAFLIAATVCVLAAGCAALTRRR